MKKILFALALFASTQAFAIAGIGAHYVMNTGSLGASSGVIDVGNSLLSLPVTVNQEASEGLQGLGFKVWIDFLPFVDIEGTFNFAAARYRTSITLPYPIDETVYLSYPMEAPFSLLFDDASPIYGVATGDVSVTYPFDILPIIRPYVGVGFSYFVSTPVVNAAFVEKVIADVDITDPTAVEGIGDAVINTLKNSDYESGMGGHVIAGVRLKLPVIPLAVYANGKYYFGGNTNSKFSQGFVAELGGGFAL